MSRKKNCGTDDMDTSTLLVSRSLQRMLVKESIIIMLPRIHRGPLRLCFNSSFSFVIQVYGAISLLLFPFVEQSCWPLEQSLARQRTPGDLQVDKPLYLHH